jgi:hypothetical protein
MFNQHTKGDPMQNKLKRLVLATLSLAILLGTQALASNQTTITAIIGAQNTYTMVIPADTTVATDGSATALSGGLKIHNGTLETGKKVVVTPTSAHGWELTSTTVATTMTYGLYGTSAATTTQATWEYTAAEANSVAGTTKEIYVKVDVADATAAQDGGYSDTITFSAALQ